MHIPTDIIWLGTSVDCFNSKLFPSKIYRSTTGQWKDLYEKENRGSHRDREREKDYKGETNGKLNEGGISPSQGWDSSRCQVQK